MYQCTHRGTRELDILLGAYAKKKFGKSDKKTIKRTKFDFKI